MLIENNIYRNSYVANGTSTEFTISFPFLDASHIIVYKNINGLESVVEAHEYSVAGAGDEHGGTITFGSAPSNGTVIVIARNVPITQLHKYTELDNFPAQSHENALAKLTMICQQQQDSISRAITLPVTDPRTPEEFRNELIGSAESAKNWAEYAKVQADKTIRIPSETEVIAANSTTPRSLIDRFADIVNVKDFGAKGDGNTDDTLAIQAAALVGGTLFFPAGTYNVNRRGIQIKSNTAVFGEGIGKTIIRQVSANESYSSVFYCNCGVENVSFRDMSLRGLYYKSDGNYGGYDENNAVKYSFMNCGISIHGRLYQQKKNIARNGTSKNIFIENVEAEGFGFAGIHIDQADEAHVTRCTTTHCGAYGIRFLGCINHSATHCKVAHLWPGDVTNPGSVLGNRMYGISTNRIYGNSTTDVQLAIDAGCFTGLIDSPTVENVLASTNPAVKVALSNHARSLYRREENCVFAYNYIEDCMAWKGLDTHGGKNISFLYNTVVDCHIAIGVDMAGYLARHGYCRVEDIRIEGNTCYRYMADMPWEGNGGTAEKYQCAGPAINVGAKETAYDAPEEGEFAVDIAGYNLHICGNNIVGWGEKGRNIGAISVYYFKNVNISNNIIRNSRTSAISLIGRVINTNINGNVIRDVRDSDASYGDVICRGISVSFEDVSVVISSNTFMNTRSNTIYAMSLPTLDRMSSVVNSNIFLNGGTGSIAEFESPQYVDLNYYSAARAIAYGYVSASSTISNGGNVGVKGYGFETAVKVSTGKYKFTLNHKIINDNNVSVNITRAATSVSGMGFDSATFDKNTGEIIVQTRDTSGAQIDNTFFITVFGY